MAVSIFVIIWVIFEASMKIYILSHIVKMVQEKVTPPPPLFNSTLNFLKNSTLVAGSIPGDLNVTTPGSPRLAHEFASRQGAVAGQHYAQVAAPAPPVYKQSLHYYNVLDNIPLARPFFPYFMENLSQATGLYEGIPMLPKLYSNARYKKNFSRIQSNVIVLIFVFVMLFSPLCVAAYGSNLRDIVLLNLDYGTFEMMI